MSITYSVLSSGSAGNSIWVRGGGVQVLVDCGLSAKQISARLADVGGDIQDIQAVVCTHGHGDHVRGAAVLARRWGINIFGTEQTISLIRNHPPKEKVHTIPRGGSFSIGELLFSSVATMHDCPGSCAFIIDDKENRLGIVTDLGIVTANLVKSFQGLDALVMEMNHDEDMLHNGPYPYFLKKRIRSNLGHLSNRQGSDLLSGLAHPALQHLTLAHLSEENNRPAKALHSVGGVLAGIGLSPGISVAGPDASLEPVSLQKVGQLCLGPW